MTRRPSVGHIVSMTTDADRFGASLKRERERLGLTQGELEQRIGWDSSTISKYEGGARKTVPPRDEIARVEIAMGIEDGALLRAAGYQSPAPAGRRTLSYMGQDLTPEQEQDVLDYIDWVRSRDK